jgi:hypothetical protein
MNWKLGEKLHKSQAVQRKIERETELMQHHACLLAADTARIAKRARPPAMAIGGCGLPARRCFGEQGPTMRGVTHGGDRGGSV